MGWIEGVLFCDGCGAEVSMATVVVRDGAFFCCSRCADGERCDCGLILEKGPPRESEAARGVESPLMLS
jgi:hypothetical protein